MAGQVRAVDAMEPYLSQVVVLVLMLVLVYPHCLGQENIGDHVANLRCPNPEGQEKLNGCQLLNQDEMLCSIFAIPQDDRLLVTYRDMLHLDLTFRLYQRVPDRVAETEDFCTTLSSLTITKAVTNTEGKGTISDLASGSILFFSGLDYDSKVRLVFNNTFPIGLAQLRPNCRLVYKDLDQCIVKTTMDQWIKRGTNRKYKYSEVDFWQFYKELYTQELKGRTIEVTLIGNGRFPSIQDSWLTNILPPEMGVEILTLKNAAIPNENMFIAMPSLRYLNLAGDSILRISKVFFEGVPNVERLVLSRNSISSLSDGLPSQLQTLDLSFNELTSLEPLETLPRTLLELDVSTNRLQRLPRGILDALPRLQRLDVSRNALAGAPQPLLMVSRGVNMLNFSGNGLTLLRLAGNASVGTLDASDNNVTFWEAHAETLVLERNPLVVEALLASTPTEVFRLDLSSEFQLDCDPCKGAARLQRWMRREELPALEHPLFCVGMNTTLLDLDDLNDDDCDRSWATRHYVQTIILLLGVVAALVSAFAACYVRRFEITYMVHMVRVKREQRSVQERPDAASYKYDAFVCYSGADRDWVIGKLLPRLEHPGADGPAPLRLCLHERDFPLGFFIADNIMTSMKNSRHTVFILTTAFVESEWCRWELELATSKVQSLVLLELERLNRNRLPRHLRYLMDTRTYLEWPRTDSKGETGMWRRLHDTLRGQQHVPAIEH